MNSRSREWLVLLAFTGIAIVLFFRPRGFLSVAGDPRPDDNGISECLVWSGEKPTGQTWMNLGKGGGIDYPEESAVDGKGKALTIRFAGEGYRGCGLNWKGWFPAEACDDASKFTSLVFYVRQTGDTVPLDLMVSLVDNQKRTGGQTASNVLHVIGDGGLKTIDRTWRKVVLPLNKFAQNKPLRLDRLWEINFANVGSQQATIQIDRIGFSTELPPALSFPEQPRYKATALVDLARLGHSIKDGIYGVCGLPEENLREYEIPITRWGGNSSTRYNWKINADNGASDWYFKNRGEPIDDEGDIGYLKSVKRAQSRNATAYITLPMIGWVAKDHQSYGFSVKKYGQQKGSEPGHPDIGDGWNRNGMPIKNNDPTDTSIAVGPEFIAEAVRLIKDRAGALGTRYYALDNEPMIWHQTHRDVRPDPLGYDELWERTVKYAEAIKKADPSARVAGFCSWGWTDLFFSAKDEGGDRYATRLDHRAHGSMPLAEWFIRKCGDYKARHGKPLIDIFDMHWYPQSEHRGKSPYQGKGMDPNLNELRLRSTRDLWDPEYIQESWIRGTGDQRPTRVLRRVREWIDRHNPGMELCVGEYNFGGGDNVTGGLAQADLFGILAREKVDLAFLWHTPEGSQNLAWKLFRNYDGEGGRFGQNILNTASTHPDLTVHAAKRSDGALTIVVINKNLGGPCDLKLDVLGLKGKMRIWRFDQRSNRVSEMTSEAGPVDSAIQVSFPPASASMIVVK